MISGREGGGADVVSIVVPVLNEAGQIEGLGTNLAGLAGKHEVIFADGGSVDGTAEAAGRFGRVVRSGRGRGRQMNAGAREARGEILLFLHADCRLGRGAVEAIERAVKRGGLAGGCLTQVFRESARWPIYGWIAFSGTVRARMTRRFYGDQGIFCRREAFESAGGYGEDGVMEDVELSRALGRVGKTAVLSVPVYGSVRRWREHGVVRTTLVNWAVLAGHLMGRDGRELEATYRSTAAR